MDCDPHTPAHGFSHFSQNNPATFLRLCFVGFVPFLSFSYIFRFPLFCCPGLLSWNNFLACKLRMMSFNRRINLCIGLSLSGADLLLQLKISHGLTDFYVIDRS
jgi:hypothetical protein